jgi:hypothetical protein
MKPLLFSLSIILCCSCSHRLPVKAVFTPQANPNITRASVAKRVTQAAESADQISDTLISTRAKLDSARAIALDIKNDELVKQLDDVLRDFSNLQLYSATLKEELTGAQIDLGTLKSEIDLERAGKLAAQESYTTTYAELTKQHDALISTTASRDTWRKSALWLGGSLITSFFLFGLGLYFRVIRFLF